MKSLSECRSEIDRIDKELLELLVRRIDVAESVAKYKLENNMKVFDETREKAVLDKIRANSPPDVSAELTGTFDGIMNMSKLRQYRLKSQYSPVRAVFEKALANSGCSDESQLIVGVQGAAGAYSEMAARSMYPAAEIRFYSGWSEIFDALNRGEINRGVLPVENSIFGSVSDVYRLIIDNDAYIVGSKQLHISHCLLAKPGVLLSDIGEITSHPQALGQCSDFISRGNYKSTQSTNTAVAAFYVANSNRFDLAAIAQAECAEKYGLQILARDIQNESNNTTRFAAISKKLEIADNIEGESKISIRFSLAHREGTLARILGCFAALGLNLTKIESRPIPSKPFEYRFYVDFIGSMHDAPVFDLVSALSDELADFRFMGNYIENEISPGE